MQLLILALRNLTRNGRRSVITTAAVAVGLGMMILMANLNQGVWDDAIATGTAARAGHIVLQHPEWSEDEPAVWTDGMTHLPTLQETFPDATFTPRIQLSGLLTSPTNSVGVGMRAADPVAEAEVDALDERLVEGEWLTDDHPRGVLIGVALAKALSVELGDKVVFMVADGDDMRSELLRVRGIFRYGAAEMDGFYIFAPLAIGQKLVGAPDGVHRLSAHFDTAARAPAAREAAQDALSDTDVAILTWDQALPELVTLAKVKKQSADFASVLLALIVALGVINTMLMSVLERTRELGVILALGMRPRRLASLVLLEGAMLGVVGVVFGLLWSVPASYWLATSGLDYRPFVGDTLDTGGVVIDALFFGGWDVTRMVVYCLAAIVLSALSAAYPALWVARLNPVDAMRST